MGKQVQGRTSTGQNNLQIGCHRASNITSSATDGVPDLCWKPARVHNKKHRPPEKTIEVCMLASLAVNQKIDNDVAY